MLFLLLLLFSKRYFSLFQLSLFMESRSHLGNIRDVFTHRASKQEYIRKEIKRKRARNSVCVSSLKAEWLVAGARLWWKREALCEGAVRFSVRPSVATDTLLFPLVPHSSERPPKFNNGNQMTNELLNKHFYRTQGYPSMNYDNFRKCREDCLDVITPFTVLVYI